MLRLLPLLLLITLLGCKTDSPSKTTISAAPQAKKVIHTFREHDNTREDPYHWLSDKNNPEVIQVLEKENEHTTTTLAHTKDLQDKLYEELIARIEQKYESLPTKNNGYWESHRVFSHIINFFSIN